MKRFAPLETADAYHQFILAAAHSGANPPLSNKPGGRQLPLRQTPRRFRRPVLPQQGIPAGGHRPEHHLRPPPRQARHVGQGRPPHRPNCLAQHAQPKLQQTRTVRLLCESQLRNKDDDYADRVSGESAQGMHQLRLHEQPAQLDSILR